MIADADATDRNDAAALLEWWLESGVDVVAQDEPHRWLATAAPTAPPPQAPENTVLPETLDSFVSWIEGQAGLPFDRPGARKVMPEGAVGAEIMLMTDMASVEDGDRPLGGEARALAEKMLAAIGFTPDQAYVANLSCLSAPGARFGDAERERCAELARQHVRLAAPKRLILFGDEPARALLGAPAAKARGKIHKVEGVRTIATFAPAWLLRRPGDKALAWRDLLLLMEED